MLNAHGRYDRAKVPDSHLNMQVGFVSDDVATIIKDSVSSVLQTQQYSEHKVRPAEATCTHECSSCQES